MPEEPERKLDFEDREIVLRADFSQLDDEDCLEVSLRFVMEGPRAPREGEWVYLLDSAGAGCLGQIRSIGGRNARVCPDWTSLAKPETPPAPGEAG